MSALQIVVYFFLYSFLGWMGDTTVRSVSKHKFTTGSFFPIPLCPIYGFGALLILALQPLLDAAPILVQGIAYGLLLAAVEAATGVVIQAVFGRSLWDYSEGRNDAFPFTDVWHVLLWGALAIILVRYVHPVSVALF